MNLDSKWQNSCVSHVWIWCCCGSVISPNTRCHLGCSSVVCWCSVFYCCLISDAVIFLIALFSFLPDVFCCVFLSLSFNLISHAPLVLLCCPSPFTCPPLPPSCPTLPVTDATPPPRPPAAPHFLFDLLLSSPPVTPSSDALPSAPRDVAPVSCPAASCASAGGPQRSPAEPSWPTAFILWGGDQQVRVHY